MKWIARCHKNGDSTVVHNVHAELDAVLEEVLAMKPLHYMKIPAQVETNGDYDWHTNANRTLMEMA